MTNSFHVRFATEVISTRTLWVYSLWKWELEQLSVVPFFSSQQIALCWQFFGTAKLVADLWNNHESVVILATVVMFFCIKRECNLLDKEICQIQILKVGLSEIGECLSCYLHDAYFINSMLVLIVISLTLSLSLYGF